MKKRINYFFLLGIWLCLSHMEFLHGIPEDTATNPLSAASLLTPTAISTSLEKNTEPLDSLSDSAHITPETRFVDQMPLRNKSKSALAPAQKLTKANHEHSTQTVQKTASPTQQKNQQKQEQGSIEFHFEDADLRTLIAQVAELFHVTFITDDIVTPLPKDGKAILGNKISFKTHKPLTQAQAWHLFITFLDLAGFALVPQADPTVYRIVKTEAAKSSAIPVLIGIDYHALPDTDQIIRYIYFVQNSDTKMLKTILDASKSSVGSTLIIEDLNAIMITDRAYNIKTLMEIVTEFDKVTQPQAMAIVKLTRANAADVKAICDSLTQPEKDKGNGSATVFPAAARKQPTTTYFPENVRIIAEPRTNVIILLGTQDGIKIIENFITDVLDKKLDQPYSPLRYYTLKYADATTIAGIMTNMVKFGTNTAAGSVGGVRDGDKYFNNVSFTAEPETNRLIINANTDDYNHIKSTLDQLDQPQPQIGMEVLIFSLDLSDVKALGTQLRSQQNALTCAGQNVKFQTSGLRPDNVPKGILTNPDGPGIDRLLSNLVALVTGAGPGNTAVSFGQDQFGVWGIFNAFERISNTQIISNPFLVATNKQPAKVVIGETRRVVNAEVIGGNTEANAFTDQPANLSVEVTPQINTDGMILLNVTVKIDTFLNPDSPTSATTLNKKITTNTIVADGEILALGGLMVSTTTDGGSKVPILGDIPLFGWFFKNRGKDEKKSTLLVLISTHLIAPESGQLMRPFTQQRINTVNADSAAQKNPVDKRDPIYQYMFAQKKGSVEDSLDTFYFKRQRGGRTQRRKRKKREVVQHQRRKTPLEQVSPHFAELLEKNPIQGSVVAHAKMTIPQVNNKATSKRSKPALSDFFSNDSVEAL